MARKLLIIDLKHSDYSIGDECQSFEEATAELKRLASIPWDNKPNRAPCSSWKTCGRDYAIVELNPVDRLLVGLGRTPVLLEISASGVVWHEIPEDVTPY